MAATRSPDRVESNEFGLAVGRVLPPAFAEVRRLRLHVHSELELNLVRSGGFKYVIGGDMHVMPPGRLACFWAGIPHGLVTTEPATDYLWLTLPLATFLRWQLPSEFISRLLSGAVVFSEDAGSGGEDAYMFERWLDTFESSPESSNALLLEIQARLWRLVRATGETSSSARVEPAGAMIGHHVEAVTRYINDHFTEPLSVQAIAAKVGLHPNYLMRIFKRGCGITVWEYVLRLRVAHAQRLLTTSQETVTDVALECGFESLSSFYYVFQRLSQWPPGAYRRRASEAPRLRPA